LASSPAFGFWESALCLDAVRLWPKRPRRAGGGAASAIRHLMNHQRAGARYLARREWRGMRAIVIRAQDEIVAVDEDLFRCAARLHLARMKCLPRSSPRAVRRRLGPDRAVTVRATSWFSPVAVAAVLFAGFGAAKSAREAVRKTTKRVCIRTALGPRSRPRARFRNAARRRGSLLPYRSMSRNSFYFFGRVGRPVVANRPPVENPPYLNPALPIDQRGMTSFSA